MRRGVVLADAGFEAVLGTVLVLGALFGDIDADDFPSPGTTAVIAVFGVALWLLAVALAEIVKRDAVSDTVLLVLAVGNSAFALLIAVWVLVADDFTGVGETVVWVTAAALMVLAIGQVVALTSQPRGEDDR
jgi:drug/metabolite transporter (DMT)-like permease